MNFCTTPS